MGPWPKVADVVRDWHMNGPVFLAWYNVRQGWLPENFKLQSNWIEVFYFVNTYKIYKYLTCGCTSFSSTNHSHRREVLILVAQCGPMWPMEFQESVE